MNFSCDRDSGDSTTPSLTRWISTSNSSMVTQSRRFRYRRSVFSTSTSEPPAVLSGEGDHAAERGAAGLLGGLDVNEFFGDF